MTQQTGARTMHKRLALHYLRFAQEEAEEAPGACPIYAAVAEAVASSPEVLSFLPESPEHERQSEEM